MHSSLALVSRRVFLTQLHDILGQITGLVTVLAVRPLATISDTSDLAIKSDGTTLRHTCVGASLHAVPQHVDAEHSVVPARASVQLVEINAVLESAVFHEVLGRDLLVIAGHAHCEAEMDLGVWIEICSAEFKDVA